MNRIRRAWRQSGLRDWLRWKLADWENRHRDVCWADLILWALDANGDYGWLELFSYRGTAGRCYRHGEIPYCGKCWRTGLHVELGGLSYEEADMLYAIDTVDAKEADDE